MVVMSTQGSTRALLPMKARHGCELRLPLPANSEQAPSPTRPPLHHKISLDIVEFIPSLLYFGYTALMVLSFWLLTGTIGFYAAYMFVRKIYAAVKID
ncbi:transmembrane 9 superfamily member 4 isoform X4 [Prionailurus iriomotensis]